MSSNFYAQRRPRTFYARKKNMSFGPRRAYPRAASRVPRNHSVPNTRNTQYKYPGVGRRVGGSVGRMAGNVVAPGVGGFVGDLLGQAVGGGAQALLKKVTGFGDYSVSKNSIVYNQDAVPEFSSNNERVTVVSHREFIQDIVSSTNYQNNSFRINPNDAGTFPWLSGLAHNYEQYVVQGMIFEYKTTSATAIGSTDTALGTVVMATQYNSLSQPFTNKQQMENYEFSQSTVPSQSICHPIECDPTQTQCGGIFNMYNPADTSGDLRLYDIGRFNIATVGMQEAGSVIGELWVTYKVCLLKPRLQGSDEVGDGYTFDAATIQMQTAPVGALAPVPFVNNVGIVTQYDEINQFVINPSYSGYLMAIASYSVTSITTSLRTPLISHSGGGIIDYAYDSYFGPNSNTSTVSTFAAADGPGNRVSVSLFKVQGGYDSNGVPARLTLDNGAQTGTLVCTAASVIFISMPNDFQPSFA